VENPKKLESVSPEGEVFAIPAKTEYAPELERLKKLTSAARAEGKEIRGRGHGRYRGRYR
jgi:hypothetical protein